jgi:hypothetical protein
MLLMEGRSTNQTITNYLSTLPELLNKVNAREMMVGGEGELALYGVTTRSITTTHKNIK